jgi:hypothetical protein
MRRSAEGIGRQPSLRVTAVGMALQLAALCAAAGCGSAAPPPVRLDLSARWNRDPGTVDEIGYRVSIEVGWPTRREDCFPLPADLTVALNDRQVVLGPMGDCADGLPANFNAVAPDAPVNVRVFSGSHVYGQAIYDNLFPGFGAQLASNGSNQLIAGSQVEVTLPPTANPVATDLYSAHFVWTVPGPSGVPFYTFAPGKEGSDRLSALITVPSTPTGPAQLIVESVFQPGGGLARSCTGFTFCNAVPDNETAGPISVQVTP